MHPDFRLSPKSEKERYETHNNDINDEAYRKFASPLVKQVTGNYQPGSRGLDFGAGTGPVASAMLREQGYDMTLYDPFFHNDPASLVKSYDFIICCEVIEHFYNPATEFRLLRSLLDKKGKLICMTELLMSGTDFADWWYKNDETHVFFYTPESIAWIGARFSFDTFIKSSRIVIFTAS